MMGVEDVIRGAGGDPAGGPLDGFLLEALINQTTLAIGVLDASGTITLMSPGLCDIAMVDYAPVSADVIPDHFNVHTADGSRLLRPEEEPLNRARSGETFRDVMTSVLRRDGTFVVLRCSGAPLRREDGSDAGGIVLFDDVSTEWLATREQEVLRDRLLQTFNHELRTPLAALIGHAELLGEIADELDSELPAQALRSLTAVLQAGERLRDLADTVSAMADLDNARRADRSPADVSALAAEAVRRTRASAPGGVSVVFTAPPTLEAQVDATQVERAIQALIDNAVMHAPAGTAVEVVLSEVGDEVVLEVADHGEGIPERQRERLVRPFERGDVELTSPSGRGLGLAVARTVAMAHQGSLVLGDNAPHGLRATLRLLTRPTP